MNKTGKSGKSKSKAQDGSFYAGGEELVKIDEAAEDGFESGASPMLRGDKLGGTVKEMFYVDQTLPILNLGRQNLDEC